MLLVQEYLLDHSLGDLAKDHGVYASFSKSGHKASFNYDMIEAKESDPLACQCRGLILSAKDGRSFLDQSIRVNSKDSYDNVIMGETLVLARSFDRFFNYGQGFAANIDFNSPGLKIYEKLDGSLIIFYYDRFAEQWNAATRAVPEADLLMDNKIYTFRGLFEKALKNTSGLNFDDFCKILNKNYTYMFELTTPLNEMVVKYSDYSVTLLGARNLFDGLEIQPEAISVGIPVVKSYPISSKDDLIKWVSDLDLTHEGVVVRDNSFNRVKIKSPAYCAAHRLRDSLGASPRNIMEIILLEQDDDAIPFLPEEIIKNLKVIKKGLQLAIKDHELVFKDLLALELKNKKDFAITVMALAAARDNKLWTAPFYKMYEGKVLNMKDFIAQNRKDGNWGSSFIDKLLELSKSYSI